MQIPQTAHCVIRRNHCPACESAQVISQKPKETYWGIGSMNCPICTLCNWQHFLSNEDAAQPIETLDSNVFETICGTPLTKNAPDLARAFRSGRDQCGKLLSSGCRSVKLGWTLRVFGEHDVDFCAGWHRNDHAAVGVEAHHFGIARGPDILGETLPQHVVF